MNPGKKFFIEVIEDEPAILQSLKDTLEREGFTIFPAKDGEEGLAIALEKHPDLILLDIVMPKIDGLAMLRTLRENDWGKSALVIALTNYGDSERMAKALELKITDYLVKSDWNLEDIVRQIKRKLGII